MEIIMAKPHKVIKATSVSVGRCDDCEGMHIYLHGEDGEVLAEAVLGDQQLRGYAHDVVTVCEEIFSIDGDSIGECMGRA